MYDFNDAAPQREPGVVMPDGTFVKLRAKLRKGGATVQGFPPEDNGVFTKSKTSESYMLDFEFEVQHGPFARNKVFENWTVVGGEKMDDKGQSVAGNITKSRIRALLESAQGLRSDDESDGAKAKRRLPALAKLDGIPFVARLMVEAGGPAPNGGYFPDKNRIAKIITAEDPEYLTVFNGGEVAPKPLASTASRPAAAAGGATQTPAWSQGGGQEQLPGTAAPAAGAGGWAGGGAPAADTGGGAWNGAAGAPAPAGAPAAAPAAGPAWIS
jgi:hypothetical protein